MATGNGSKALRRYEMRDEKGGWLATVVISEDGYFSTVSEYGNYAYWWTCAGDCFRSFLTNIDDDYLVGKISPGYQYDGDLTLLAVKRRILRDRRSGTLSVERARHEWELLSWHNSLESKEDYAVWGHQTELDVYSDGLYQTSRDSRATLFASRVLPRFQEILKAELETERKGA